MSDAQQLIYALMQQPENCICADCGAKKSEWASTTLGVFVCIDCSGVHRSLGTHITLVRSCTLDSWTQKLASHMLQIGNQRANEYWESKLPADFKRPQAGNLSQITMFIKQKYIQRKWAADGPSPNEILENKAKPQVQRPLHLRHKHRSAREEKSECIADRIRDLKRGKGKREKSHIHHAPLIRYHSTPETNSDPFGSGDEVEVPSHIQPPKPVEEQKVSLKEEKEKIDDDDDDDFYSETKPKSAAAKALMMGYSPAHVRTATIKSRTQPVSSTPPARRSRYQRRNEKVRDTKPHLKFKAAVEEDEDYAYRCAMQKPLYQAPVKQETNKERLDSFFGLETERAPIAQRPTIIRSGNRLKRAHEEQTKSKLSARLRQRIERRTKEVPLQRAPLHFVEGGNDNADSGNDSSSDPFE